MARAMCQGNIARLKESAMRHLVSFLLNPFGYLLNLLCTILVHMEYIPVVKVPVIWAGARYSSTLTNACDRYCSRDGVQDDMLF